jgi:transposase
MPGENLAHVLAQRVAELPPPIQMADALSRNFTAPLKTIVANCIAHARRKYVEVAPNFPEQCRFVLETLAAVYKNDAICKEQQLSPEERLRYHQVHSDELMKSLEIWLKEQFELRLVEPNSGLGQAITYMSNHWLGLTLFLRKAGAPLDNNLTEQSLKRAILHRKNALFYRSDRGAQVGDTFMSLIHTCALVDANPFDYLSALQKHSTALAHNSEQWMPWNYRESLAQLDSS